MGEERERSTTAHMIFQESVQALVAIGNQKKLTEIVDALSQVSLLVGGNEDPLVRPQRGETNGGVPSGEGMKAELMAPGGVADSLCPVKSLGRTCHL